MSERQPRHHEKIPALEAMMDDLAVEISLEMKRRDYRLCDLRHLHGVGKRRLVDVSKFLRGASDSPIGYIGALDIAMKLGIPFGFFVGKDELPKSSARTTEPKASPRRRDLEPKGRARKSVARLAQQVAA